MKFHLGVFAVVAGCGSFPSNGSRSDPYEVHPEFGTHLLDLPAVVTATVDTIHKNDTLFIAIWTAGGLDDNYDVLEPGFQIWSVDPVSFDLRELDPPELVSPTFNLSLAFGEGQALLVETGNTPVLYLYDGDWNFLPLPNGMAAEATAFYSLDIDRIWARTGTAMQVWDGATWRSVPIDAGELLGPLARDRFRTVSSGPCTRQWDFATLIPSEPVCATGCAGVPFDTINGTPDAFALGCSNLVYPFTAGAFSAPIDVGPNAVPYSNLGGPYTWSPTLDTYPTVSQLEGTSPRVALPGFSPVIDCECDRNVDPTCECVSPRTEYGDVLVSGDASQAHAIITVVANAERAIYLRAFDLPTDEQAFPGGSDTATP